MAARVLREDLVGVQISTPRPSMFNQKGQIHMIVLLLIVVGFVLYANFSDGSFLKKFLFPSFSPASSPAKSAPNQGSRISSPDLPVAPAQSVSAPEYSDIVPPQRFNPQPTGSLPAETRKITLNLGTDEKATCRYSSETSGVHYDSMQGKFDQTDSASHSVLITTLSEGGQYRYYVKCSDEKGNKNSDDFVISFEVKLPEDKTPPVLKNPSHQGDVLPAGTGGVTITISTDEPASCRYATNPGVSYSSMSGGLSYYDETKKFHVKSITGLQNGLVYNFFVRCRDFAGNANVGDVLISFSVGM
jgi:hypothetical protein